MSIVLIPTRPIGLYERKFTTTRITPWIQFSTMEKEDGVGWCRRRVIYREKGYDARGIPDDGVVTGNAI